MKITAGRLGLNLLVWAGGAMLAASGVLHFHLWSSEGYRHIPTIGPLFLAQAIICVVLAIAAAFFRKLVLVAGAAGLAISSIGALLISIWWGLFGWQESSGAPYVGMAFAVEAIAGVLLGVAAVLLAWPWWSGLRRGGVTSRGRARVLPPAAVFAGSGEPTRPVHPGSTPSGPRSRPAN
jgi:hypothetical protein